MNLLGGDYSPEVAAHLTKIEAAISRRKTIRFTYYSIGRDERDEREVDPYSLLYSAGNWYMVGFSHERGAMRNFRLSRIEGRITFKTRSDHDFPSPQDFDLSRYRDRAPWQLESTTGTATIALTPTIAWWVEQMFGTYGETAIRADGSGIYTTGYGSRHDLVAWVLGLGAEAEVVEPADLRDAVVAALRLVRDRHRGGDEGASLETGAGGAPGAEVEAAVRAPDPRGAAPRAAQPVERVVPAERFARLLALMTRLLAACGESAEAQIPAAELRTALNVSRKVLEEDLGLLNLINFGGGCYALFAQIESDTVVVQKDTYGDRFARPARLSPLEAKALLWALEFIGDRLPIEAGGALLSAREKVQAAIDQEGPPAVELGRMHVANAAVAARGQPGDPRRPPARAGVLDRVARRDHPAHHRAPPARELPRRLVRGRLLPARGRPAHLPAGPHPRRSPDGRALRAARRDHRLGPVPALRPAPGRRRHGRPERLGVVQPGLWRAGWSSSIARASASPTARRWSRSPTRARTGW